MNNLNLSLLLTLSISGLLAWGLARLLRLPLGFTEEALTESEEEDSQEPAPDLTAEETFLQTTTATTETPAVGAGSVSNREILTTSLPLPEAMNLPVAMPIAPDRTTTVPTTITNSTEPVATETVPAEIMAPTVPAPTLSEPISEFALPVADAATPAVSSAVVEPLIAESPSLSTSDAPQPSSPPMTNANALDQQPFPDAVSLEAAPKAVSEATATIVEPVQAISPIDDRRTGFNSSVFKQAFVNNLLWGYGKSLQTATSYDLYVLLTKMVQERLRLLRTAETTAIRSETRLVGEVAPYFRVAPHLEGNLINLGIVNPVLQALQELGIDLNDLLDLEPGVGLSETDELACILAGNLDAYATANVPAIGYGLRPATTVPSHANFWETERTDLAVQVKFGGTTEGSTDAQGRHRVRWLPQRVVQGIPYDILVPGYCAETASILRLWAAIPADALAPAGALSLDQLTSRQLEEWNLQQQYFLISCAVQDALRLGLKAGGPITNLSQRLMLHINQPRASLAVAELMYQLVDERGVEWDKAWAIAQTVLSATFHTLMPVSTNGASTAGSEEFWTIDSLVHLLPRHLEIIYEINRRLIDQVRVSYPGQEERVRQLSLIGEASDLQPATGDRTLRNTHLAMIGGKAVSGASAQHTQLLQRRLLNIFSELYPNKLATQTDGINHRRFLLQINPRLAHVLTQWLGEDWIAAPQTLHRLKQLLDNNDFCGSWWQVRRDVKQDFADYAQQRIGLVVNLNALFDVQVAPIRTDKRQLLNLLHIITLYVRIKQNSDSDTMQRFAHRSIPRTCIIAGRPSPNDSIAQEILKLLQGVATTINTDPDMQDRLQVVLLPDEGFQSLRYIYPAADLAEYLDLAGQAPPTISLLKFALNGARAIGTPTLATLALKQHLGAESAFVFGMTEKEVADLQACYEPLALYSASPELQHAINLIAEGYFSNGDTTVFKPLGNWLLCQDPALVLADYQSYLACQEQVSQACQDQKQWTKTSVEIVAEMCNLLTDITSQHRYTR